MRDEDIQKIINETYSRLATGKYASTLAKRPVLLVDDYLDGLEQKQIKVQVMLVDDFLNGEAEAKQIQSMTPVKKLDPPKETPLLLDDFLAEEAKQKEENQAAPPVKVKGERERAPGLVDDFLAVEERQKTEAKASPGNPGNPGRSESSEPLLLDDFLKEEDKKKQEESASQAKSISVPKGNPGSVEKITTAREGVPGEGERATSISSGKVEDNPGQILYNTKGGGKLLISEQMIRGVGKGSLIKVSGGYILTPAARDLVAELKVKIVEIAAEPPKTADKKADQITVVALGSDHRGFEMKKELKNHLIKKGIEVQDVGTDSPEGCDFPDYAKKVAEKVISTQAQRGVMIDGIGVGSAMAANKVKGIRAAVCNDIASAASSRAHNNANLLTMGAAIITVQKAKEIVDTWLKTPYEGGRHQKRINKITRIEEGTI